MTLVAAKVKPCRFQVDNNQARHHSDHKMNTNVLDALKINYHLATVLGTEYAITSGTGDGTFAYSADTIDIASIEYDNDDAFVSYQDFCDVASPDDDRDLAIALAAREDTHICTGGTGTPVLSDEEYKLVRAAVASLRG